VEIHERKLGAEVGHDLQRRQTIGRDLDSVTARAQQQCEDLADVLLVVHHQDRPRPHFGTTPAAIGATASWRKTSHEHAVPCMSK